MYAETRARYGQTGFRYYDRMKLFTPTAGRQWRLPAKRAEMLEQPENSAARALCVAHVGFKGRMTYPSLVTSEIYLIVSVSRRVDLSSCCSLDGYSACELVSLHDGPTQTAHAHHTVCTIHTASTPGQVSHRRIQATYQGSADFSLSLPSILRD